MKSQTLAKLNALYEQFGVVPNPQLKDREDHLSVELEFMQLLAAKEAYAEENGHGGDKLALCRGAQKKFLENHLGLWGRAFSGRLDAHTGGRRFYGALARLLDAYLEHEIREIGLPPGPIPPLADADAENEDETCPESPL